MNELYIYIALYCVLLYTQSALQSGGGGLSSTTTSVQHPHGWCDGCHRTTAPVRSPHTSYRWRGERVIEPIKCMRSPHTSYRWRGERVMRQSSVRAHHHTSYRWRGERSHRDNQVYALTTHQLQGGRGERVNRARSVYALTTQLSYRWRGERVIESIKCMSHHTPANRWDERES